VIDPDMPVSHPSKVNTHLSDYERWNKQHMENELRKTESFTFQEKLWYVLG
jgi:hypothetical protein